MGDLDEWRMAVADMTEAERQEACGHLGWMRGNACPDCGTEADE